MVTTSYPAELADPSGHFVRAEALRLAARGARVSVFAPAVRSGGRAAVAAFFDGIDRVPIPGGDAFGWPGVAARLREAPLRVLGALRWTRAAEDALRHAGPFDRVIAHWAVPSAWPVARRAPGTLEVLSHGGDVRLLVALPTAARERMVAAITARCASWRFVSEPLLSSLLGALPRPLAARVEGVARVEACRIDVPDVREPARALRASLGRFGVSVARLVPSKGVDRVIAHVARHDGGRLLVVVGDGTERRSLERLAARHRVRARFVGTRPREDALAYLAASEELLFASQVEGCSTVLREAAALGVRVRRV